MGRERTCFDLSRDDISQVKNLVLLNEHSPNSKCSLMVSQKRPALFHMLFGKKDRPAGMNIKEYL